MGVHDRCQCRELLAHDRRRSGEVHPPNHHDGRMYLHLGVLPIQREVLQADALGCRHPADRHRCRQHGVDAEVGGIRQPRTPARGYHFLCPDLSGRLEGPAG